MYPKYLDKYAGAICKHSDQTDQVLFIKYSWLSLSRPRLSRITAYLEVKILSLLKHENLTTGKKYCGKA